MDNGAENYLRYLNGDDGGIAEIVREYKDSLIFFLNGYVKNIYTAEDLTEETFFRLMVKKPKFTPRYSFKTWLFTIGKNIALDYIRKNSRHRILSEEEAKNQSTEVTCFEKRIICEENKRILHAAIKKLPTQYSRTLHLIYFEDFDNNQTAKIMNKSKRQIEMLIYRAKNALKIQLEKEGFVYEE